MVGGRNRLRRRRAKSVRGMIVVDQNGLAVGIVSAGMAPIKRACTDDGGENPRQRPTDDMMPYGTQPHR